MADPTGNNSGSGVFAGAVAGGDLSGTFPNPSVAQINGVVAGPAATAILGQIPGIATSALASAGNVGEFTTAALASTGALTLSTGVGTSIVGLALSAGDWDVWGQAYFHPQTLTVLTVMVGAISTTAGSSAAGLPGVTSGAQSQVSLGAGLTGGSDTNIPIGPTRIGLAAAATAFLNAQLTFATSTASGYGILQARRRR